MEESKEELILRIKKIYWFYLNFLRRVRRYFRKKFRTVRRYFRKKFRTVRRYFINVILTQGPIPRVWEMTVMRPFWYAAYKLKKQDPLLPKVTIIMPVYNVENFVADSLRSARAQSYGNVEIVAINDGSTDDSLAILKYFAAKTPQLKIHSKKNAGLGAARNTGVSLAHDADYIMFMDSDDTLPIRAVEHMIAMAEQSGSDFVVGRVMRLEGIHRYQRPGMELIIKQDLLGTTVLDSPAILADVISCNKLFRKSFWDRMNFEFPVGVFYEDMTLMTKAYLSANRFDLVAKFVYNWRRRSEGESLSMRRFETKSLQDRFLVMEQIADLYRDYIRSGRIGQEFLTQHFVRILSMDLQLFVDYVRHTDEYFFSEFKSRGRALLTNVPEEVWERATGRKLDRVRFALNHNRAETVAFLESLNRPAK